MAGIRNVILFALALLAWAPAARAAEVSVRETWIFKKRAPAIVEVLVDYENYCDSGCRYSYPSVEEAVIVPYRRTPTSFYTWTRVVDFKNSEWFSHVTVTTRGRRTVVEFKMITGELAKTLERISGKPDDPLFDDVVTRFEIEEIFRDGKYLKTRFTFRAEVKLSGLIALFKNQAESGLVDTARAVARNILSAEDAAPGDDAAAAR